MQKETPPSTQPASSAAYRSAANHGTHRVPDRTPVHHGPANLVLSTTTPRSRLFLWTKTYLLICFYFIPSHSSHRLILPTRPTVEPQ
jgi:hypothetical protein